MIQRLAARLHCGCSTSELSREERIARAWRVGWLSRKALDSQRYRLGEHTPDCGLTNRCYVVLGPPRVRGDPPIARRYGTYRSLRAAVGRDLAETDTVCHGFPSVAEAEAYCAAAGAEWPRP